MHITKNHRGAQGGSNLGWEGWEGWGGGKVVRRTGSYHVFPKEGPGVKAQQGKTTGKQAKAGAKGGVGLGTALK